MGSKSQADQPPTNGRPSVVRRAAVIGAGPIGCATAGYLAMRGIEVALCDVDAAMVEPVARTGGVRLKGAVSGDAEVALATTDPAAALRGAELVVTAVPASAHEAVAAAAAPHLEPGAVILIQPGQTLSAVAFMHAARRAGLVGEVTAVETLNTVFTGRLSRPGEVDVFALKRFVAYAAYPASRTDLAADVLEPLWEYMVRCTSVLEVGLHNVNAVVHPTISLLNTGMIDSSVGFLFYVDGATEHTMKVAEAIDRERLAILNSYGLPALSLLEWLDRVYGVRGSTIHEAIAATGPYRTIAAPTSLNTRLLSEDVPCGLVPCCALAEKAGVEVPVMRAVTDVCSTICGINFWATGRTLERFGLAHLDRDGLLSELGPQADA